MSNLRLPNFHPLSLKGLLNGKAGKTVAYATTVSDHTVPGFFPDRHVFNVQHHGNSIAEIADWNVSISNCGYSSSTTAQRLTAILRDNHIPYFVAIRKGKHVLLNNDRKIVDPEFHSADFAMRAGVWERI